MTSRKATIQEIVDQMDAMILQLSTLRDTLEGSVPEAEKNALERVSKSQCTYCGENIIGDEVVFRGAHQRCYKKVNRAVHSGTITDDQAVSRGWVLPADRGGRKTAPNDPLTQLKKERSRK